MNNRKEVHKGGSEESGSEELVSGSSGKLVAFLMGILLCQDKLRQVVLYQSVY